MFIRRCTGLYHRGGDDPFNDAYSHFLCHTTFEVPANTDEATMRWMEDVITTARKLAAMIVRLWPIGKEAESHDQELAPITVHVGGQDGGQDNGGQDNGGQDTKRKAASLDASLDDPKAEDAFVKRRGAIGSALAEL